MFTPNPDLNNAGFSIHIKSIAPNNPKIAPDAPTPGLKLNAKLNILPKIPAANILL